ncbi:hypothetical protein MRX96_002889 [Rhipicephalus microplus]
MAELTPPEQLRLGENVPDNWLKFKQRIQLYFATTEQQKPCIKAQKAATFLHLADQKAIVVFDTLSISEKDKVDYDKLVEALEAYCLPQTEKSYERTKPPKVDNVDQGSDEKRDSDSNFDVLEISAAGSSRKTNSKREWLVATRILGRDV